MRRVLATALLAAVAVDVAGCGGTGPQIPRSQAAVKLQAILGAKPIWIRLARVEGGKLAWLGFSPKGNPPDRECLRPPCAHKPSPIAAFVDARGNRFDGWADVHLGKEPASPAAVVRAMRAHEFIRLAVSDRPPALPGDVRAEIRAARASDARLFAIFPRLPGRKACAIPDGAGLRGSTIVGTCRTRVTYPNEHGRYREAFVTFRESWRGQYSSWTLIVQRPADNVVATQLHGKPAPQLRYAATATSAKVIEAAGQA